MEIHFRAVRGASGLLRQRVARGQILKPHGGNPQGKCHKGKHRKRPKQQGASGKHDGLMHRAGEGRRSRGCGSIHGHLCVLHRSIVFLPRHKMAEDLAAQVLRRFRQGPHTCVRVPVPSDLAENTHPLLGPTPCCKGGLCAALPRGDVRDSAHCLVTFVNQRRMLWTAQEWETLHAATASTGSEGWQDHAVVRFPERLQKSGLPDGDGGVWVVLPYCYNRTDGKARNT